MHVRAIHYRTGEPLELEIRAGRLASLNPCPFAEDPPWVAPALFDLQINGCMGHGFHGSELNPETIRLIISTCQSHGIRALLPTLITNDFESLRAGMATLSRACQEDSELAEALPGIHLEGPYISSEDGPRGAHPKQHVRPPDREEFRRLQEAAGGRIRLVTLAPEREDALPFIEWLTEQGIVVALGHTAANGKVIRDAIRAGAKLSTHLGNGSHAVLPRHDNYIWEQLAHDDLWASLICDGHHLPAAVAKCILRVKTPSRAVLTCDASTLAGMPPGRYSEWGQDLEVREGGKVVLAGTPYLAGSGAFTDECVRFAAMHTGVSLADALDMAGARPRELLGLPPRRLIAGDPADLILFDNRPEEGFRIREVIIAGERHS